MALTGDIANYGLADILQLILNGNRSGFIHVSDTYEKITVGISDSWILHVDAESRQLEAQFASRLKRADVLNQEELGTVLAVRARTKKEVGDIVIEQGFASEEVIIQQATLFATDILFEIFTWPDGSYSFAEEQEIPQSRWMEPIAADYILMHGLRLADKWPAINQALPSFNYRVTAVHALPPEENLEELDIFGTEDNLLSDTLETSLSPEIGPNERTVHGLCILGAKIQSIIDLAPLSKFETCHSLNALIEGGFLEVGNQPPR